MDLKSELTETQAEKVVLEKEVHDQLLQLHSIQLQLHAKTGQSIDSGTIKAKLVSSLEDNTYLTCILEGENIRHKQEGNSCKSHI